MNIHLNIQPFGYQYVRPTNQPGHYQWFNLGWTDCNPEQDTATHKHFECLALFNQVMQNCKVPHGHLVDLEDAGFREDCPTAHAWWFWHPDFPGVTICWHHGTDEGTL